MQPIHHKYPWYVELHTIVYNFLGILFPLFIFFFPLIKAISDHTQITFETVALFLIIAFTSGIFSILTGNYYAEIESDKDGLQIVFLWRRLFVPWEDIIEIKPLFNVSFLKNVWVGRTRSLPIFHRLYGLLYGFSPHPSFVVSKGISNYDELIHRIQVNVKKNRRNHSKPLLDI